MPTSATPPAAVNVEIRDELWLVWDPTRGHWTLEHPWVVNRRTGAGAPGAVRDDVRVMRAHTFLTIIWQNDWLNNEA